MENEHYLNVHILQYLVLVREKIPTPLLHRQLPILSLLAIYINVVFLQFKTNCSTDFQVFGPEPPRARNGRQVASRADIDRFSPSYTRYFGSDDNVRDFGPNSFGPDLNREGSSKRKCGASSDCNYNCGGLAQCYAEKGSRVRTCYRTFFYCGRICIEESKTLFKSPTKMLG